MESKKLITHQSEAVRKNRRISMILGNILLITGSLVIVAPLVYILFNLNKSDSLVTLIMPFIFAGIVLLVVSQLICPFQFKSHR
jgi:ABC-type transport system involved in cytochrome c biogenesis permease component